MERIFKITPVNSRGEPIGNSRVTAVEKEAVGAALEGYKVESCFPTWKQMRVSLIFDKDDTKAQRADDRWSDQF